MWIPFNQHLLSPSIQISIQILQIEKVLLKPAYHCLFLNKKEDEKATHTFIIGFYKSGIFLM
jgi:hypothetical protein